MAVRITPIDAADQRDIEAYFEISSAARAADVPDLPAMTLREAIGSLRYPHRTSKAHHFLARLDGRPAGVLGVDLPLTDNVHLADISVTVHPGHRRAGIGRQLCDRGLQLARDHGRTTAVGAYVTELPGGPRRDPGFAAFAAAMGATPALPEVRRRLDLDTVDTESWAKLLADAHSRSDGYSVLSWHTAAPDDVVDEVARLEGRMVLDMPIGDLNIEQERYDADRIRHIEDNLRLRGQRHYHVAVRHDASGRLAAWTMIALDPDVTTDAFQQTTIVDPDHRGHRLGTIVKIENLHHTRRYEPELHHVHTWNAAENVHMIAINEGLGFRPVDGWVNAQREL